MAIDPRISLGVQPMQFQMPDPNSGMNALAKALQIRDLQQSGQLNALNLQEKQRGITETTAVNEAYKASLGPDGNLDRTRLFGDLANRGLGSRIPDLQKKFFDADKAKFDTQKAAFDGYKNFQMTLGSHANNPNVTKQEVLGSVAGLVQSGAFDGGVAQKLVANLPDDPQQLRMTLQQILKSQMTPEQVMTVFAPKPEKIDNGQQISFRDTNPNSPTYGQATAGGVVQKQQDPNSVASVAAQYANANATKEVAKATRDAANIHRGFESEQGLRKEFEALPEVKKYKQALPSYKGIEDAVKRNTTQADINIVYGIAKLYDPDSVVREGEYATVANSPNIPERIKGYAQYLAGGGKLTPQVKADILAEAQSRMRSYENEFVGARSNFEQIARRTNVDPTRVFPSPVSPAISPSAAPAAGGLPPGWSVKAK
jgi:hypothetical protein